MPANVPDVENAILAALPPPERARLAPLLEPVQIGRGQPIHHRGEPVRHVYFPAGALFSLLSTAGDGRVVEVGALGRAGFVGLPVVLEDDAPAFDVIGQVPGPAWRMRADHLRAELARGGPLPRLLLRFAQAHLVQTGPSPPRVTSGCSVRWRTEQPSGTLSHSNRSPPTAPGRLGVSVQGRTRGHAHPTSEIGRLERRNAGRRT